MMDCKACQERLPWLLNGTLEVEEEAAVQQHLDGCDPCRQVLQECRWAWSLHEGHLPTEALVDYALGPPLTGARRALVENHLATCVQCSEELALLREDPAMASHRGAEVERAVSWWLRSAALAATVAAVVCAAGWWFTAQQWREERAALREVAAVPRLNTPLLELVPANPGTVDRDATPNVEGLVNTWDAESLPEEAKELVLTLLSGELRCAEGCTVEILRNDGTLVWEGGGLRATADGHATLTLPRTLLPADSWTVLLTEADHPDQVFRYRIAAP